MPLPALVLLIPAGVALVRGRRSTVRGHHAKSAREDHMASDEPTETEVEHIVDAAIGIPYSYGAGTPADPFPGGATGIKGGHGYDCSGFVQGALVALGMLSESAPDRSAATLSKVGTPVPWGQQRPGDVAFYGTPVSHVMLVRTEPDATGDSGVIGASGGHSYTNGDDPKAIVKTFTSAKYRGDFRGFVRFTL